MSVCLSKHVRGCFGVWLSVSERASVNVVFFISFSIFSYESFPSFLPSVLSLSAHVYSCPWMLSRKRKAWKNVLLSVNTLRTYDVE